MVRTRSGKETIAKGSSPTISKHSKTKLKSRILKLKPCALLTEFTQRPFNFEAPIIVPPKICVLPKFTSEPPLSTQTSPFIESSRLSPLFHKNIMEQSQFNESFFGRMTPSPIPESGEILLSKEIADAVLSSLQLYTPHKLVGVRRFDFFAQNASIGTPIETILWKWLNQVVRSGMPWQDAVHQIPDILKNHARNIMLKNHARLYLSKIIYNYNINY